MKTRAATFILLLLAGCDARPVMSNAAIIYAKTECTNAGMAYRISYKGGLESMPIAVTCTEPK